MKERRKRKIFEKKNLLTDKNDKEFHANDYNIKRILKDAGACIIYVFFKKSHSVFDVINFRLFSKEIIPEYVESQ